MSNFDPVLISLISVIVGLFGGAILTIITEIMMIKHRKFQSDKTEFKKVFEDFYWEINNSEFSIQGIIANVVIPKIPLTNKTVGVFLNKIRRIRKRKKISAEYENYRNGNYVFVGSSQEKLLETYCFNESQMIKYFGKNNQFETGKDLLLYNLQQIIDLTK